MHQLVKQSLLLALCVSVVGYVAALRLIPVVAKATSRNGIHGRDINKAGTSAGSIDIPEAVGLAAAGVYLACIVILQLYSCYCSWRTTKSGPNPTSPADDQCGVQLCKGVAAATIANYNAVLATVGMMAFVGFIDDVLHPPPLSWTMKAVPALFAMQPVLVTAYLQPRPTAAVKPVLQNLFGLPTRLDIGIWYYIYLNIGASFVPNSINILAGINGLEAGQTLIIACAVVVLNILHITQPSFQQETRVATAAAESLQPLQRHLLSFSMMAPLATITLALLQFNWYPSKVFVGDSFTFFAGTAIAAAAVIGQFSGTLIIFCLPQCINALYSLPQLFNFVPYPRHRLPVFDASTGLLHPKFTRPDYTLLSMILQLFGPCTEQVLCIQLLLLQGACCALGLWMTWRRCQKRRCVKCA